jgi:tetratricopeptide (TPR) repeat protein
MEKPLVGEMRREYSRLVDEGDASRRLFQFDASFKNLNLAIRLDPQNFEAWYKKAILYWTQQNHLETAHMLHISLACNPSDYWKNVLQGFIHELNHHLHKARQHYQIAAAFEVDKLKDVESGMEAFLNLGFVELELHNYSSAVDMFRKALQRQEEFHKKIEKLEQQYGSAIDTNGQKLIKKPALIATCYNNIGHTFVHMGEDLTAIKYFTKAIEIFDRDLFFLKNRIKAYSRMNRYEDVINDCNRALLLDLSDTQAISEIYSFRGFAHYNMGKNEFAMNDFKKANTIFPKYHYPYIMTAYLALVANNTEKAIDIIDRGIEQCDHTHSLQVLYSFRVLHLSKNDINQIYRKKLKDMKGDVLERIS